MLENFCVFTTIAEGINTRFAVVCLSAIVVSTSRKSGICYYSALRILPDAYLFGGLIFWVAVVMVGDKPTSTALILDLSTLTPYIITYNWGFVK